MLPAAPDKVERSLKEALAKANLIDPNKVTRGRPSKQYIEWAHTLVALGWRIKGYSSTSTAVSTGEREVKVTKEIRRDPNAVLDVPDPARDEADWRAEATSREGKTVKVGMREVCSTPHCRASLTYCRCGTPTYRVDFDYVSPVRFVGIRKKVMT